LGHPGVSGARGLAKNVAPPATRTPRKAHDCRQGRMAELSFGEKLLIARKQLDLYQYEMAEKLGVHANSITKYERGEGKPHLAVMRMFDLLCEQQGIRFDEYENAEKGKGEKMKI